MSFDDATLERDDTLLPEDSLLDLPLLLPDSPLFVPFESDSLLFKAQLKLKGDLSGQLQTEPDCFLFRFQLQLKGMIQPFKITQQTHFKN